jgi:hypothetical protein
MTWRTAPSAPAGPYSRPTIRLSTVVSQAKSSPIFYCDSILSDCAVTTFIAYLDPDEPAHCPSCGWEAYEVVE